MAYVSLIALFFSVTNFVPVSAIGFVPIALCGWRFFGRRYPAFMTPLVMFTAFAILSTLYYNPESFLEFDFYRHDGNFFVSYLPILAGCVYMHRWDLNKILRRFYYFAVLINVPFYLWYVAQNGVLTIFRHPADTFGSYFIARNAAGGFLAILLCLGISCFSMKRSRTLLALMAANAMMLFSTYSRGSMFGILVLLPYVVFGRKRWMLATMVAGLIAASLAIAWYHTHSGTDYMGYQFSISNSDEKVANLDIRYEWLWPRALAYFRQSPIIGMGFGSFDDQIALVVHYFGLFGRAIGVTAEHSDSHAHNSYLNILAELGVVGLTMMLAFYWRLVGWCQQGTRAAMREQGRNFVAFRFVELGSVCLLAMSATEHRLTTPSNMLPIALVLSLLLASRARATFPAFMQRPKPVGPPSVATRLRRGPRVAAGPGAAPAAPSTGR
ncbi:O-antigen ligase family protein [Trinickia dinghuensis]|uniref:O-antigen ligase domain-containing protein n=1 Tax=Trinickia dinghuensis TaxID=2291023 RepID=A0A3D8JW90_9BURK|nr:O-antigen ligase family protein [Trinickia dinghuensis]RDU97327.1 O-antigen ligase domain-containing protein [Trinickia dinghuensis]